MGKRDYRSVPFRSLVVFGESTVQGGPWLADDEPKWADVLRDLVDRCQERPVKYHNEGVGASVISPRSPGYEASAKPSAMERCCDRVIANCPDLFVMAYGLNDCRAGMAPSAFAEEYDKIVHEVESGCSPVIVLCTIYHMSGYDRFPPFDKASRETIAAYNEAIAGIARTHDCLLADVHDSMGGADWLVHQDGVHTNAVGNVLVANRVFEVIAKNCSCLSIKTRERHGNTEWTRWARSVMYERVEPVSE